jgi:hypothetical protein
VVVLENQAFRQPAYDAAKARTPHARLQKQLAQHQQESASTVQQKEYLHQGNHTNGVDCLAESQ